MSGRARHAVDSAEAARALLAELAELFSSPTLHPAQIDLERGSLGFVPVGREAYRTLSFHSARWLKELTPEAVHISLATLLRRFERHSPTPTPLHLILHPAFCGSTLLSRALEVGTRTLAFREPDVLHVLQTRLAGARQAGQSTFEVERLLRLTLHLLSRHYPDQQATVVKATDAASLALDQILSSRPETRAVFIYMDPASFIATSLKSEDRREWLQKRAKWLEQRLFPDLPGGDLPGHDAPLARIAAALWVGHTRAIRAAIRDFGPGRVRSLRTETLLDQPSTTVGSIAGFFGVDVAEPVDLVPVLEEHAKHGGAYTAADRERELGALGEQHRDEIRDALQWSERTFGQEGLDTHLPAPIPG